MKITWYGGLVLLGLGLIPPFPTGWAGLIEADRLRWQSAYQEGEPEGPANQWFLPFNVPNRGDLQALTLVSVFGDHRDSFFPGHIHTAIDIAPKPRPEPGHIEVYPLATGVVCSIHLDHPHRTIVIKHRLPDGTVVFTSYKHLQTISVANGSQVTWKTPLGRLYTRREALAQGGDYDHLHLEIRKQFDDYGVASWATMDPAALEQRFYDPWAFLKTHVTKPLPRIVVINPALDKTDLSLVQPVLDQIETQYHCEYRVLHYSAVDAQKLEQAAPQGILITGQNTPWSGYPAADLERCMLALRQAQVPLFGICGGHQLIAMAFGGQVGYIRGGGDPGSYRGHFRHQGVLSAQVVQTDLLLKGLPKDPKFYFSHCEEVKQLPPDFSLLIQGPVSRVQMMRHRLKPIYGVQFHPEVAADQDHSGRLILAHFIDAILASSQ